MGIRSQAATLAAVPKLAIYGLICGLLAVLTVGSLTAPAFAQHVKIWEDDDFDSLNLGPLAGQNGWTGDACTAQVVKRADGGRMVRPNPSTGGQYSCILAKDVPDQAEGVQIFSVEVRTDNVESPQAAKIELQSNRGFGTPQPKVGQLFVGKGIRFQYFVDDGTPAGREETVSLIPRTQSGQWYHITFRLNIKTGQLTAIAESGADVVTSTTVTVHPVGAPIVSLSMSSFDEKGAVVFDNLTGVRIR